MSARNKFTPYIRRANGQEKAESLRVAYRLAFYMERKKPFYVMVQRGFPNLAVDVGASKLAISRTPLTVAIQKKSFKQWARNFGKRARLE